MDAIDWPQFLTIAGLIIGALLVVLFFGIPPEAPSEIERDKGAPPPCDPELFTHGEVAGVYAANAGSVNFEADIVAVRVELGIAVDWHYAAGRAVVKCAPGHAQEVRDALLLHGHVSAE